MAYGSAMNNAYIGPGQGHLAMPSIAPVVDDAYYVRCIDEGKSKPVGDIDTARADAAFYQREGHTVEIVHNGQIIS
jgi:hypothetical protein